MGPTCSGLGSVPPALGVSMRPRWVKYRELLEIPKVGRGPRKHGPLYLPSPWKCCYSK